MKPRDARQAMAEARIGTREGDQLHEIDAVARSPARPR